MMFLCTVFALALIHITSRWEARPARRLGTRRDGGAALLRLSPAPRALSSAEIPRSSDDRRRSIAWCSRARPAARRARRRVMDRLCRALWQPYQTAHGKGILRLHLAHLGSPQPPSSAHPDVRHIDDAERRQALVAGQAAARRATINRFITRPRVKYMVVDLARTSRRSWTSRCRSLGLMEIEENGGRALCLRVRRIRCRSRSGIDPRS